jgi:hypothetical protein
MLGIRIWDSALSLDNDDDATFHLCSPVENYVWSSPKVGEELSTLVEPYKDNYVGYHLSNNHYLSEIDLDYIHLLAEDSEQSIDDIDYTSLDYIIWDWYDSDKVVCKYYGYSAYKDFEALYEGELCDSLGPKIYGLVRGGGKINESDSEFKSEYMEVISLFCRPEELNSNINYHNNDSTKWIGTSLLTYGEYASLLAEQWNIPYMEWHSAMKAFEELS